MGDSGFLRYDRGMKRFAFAALLLAFACGEDSGDAPDGFYIDDGGTARDLGPTPPEVGLELIVAASGDNNVGPWRLLPTVSDEGTFFSFGVQALRQPGGPDLLALEGERYGFALGTSAGPAEWLAVSESVRLLSSLEDDQVWMYFHGDEPSYRVNEETVTAGELVAWGEGAIEQRVSLPADFRGGTILEAADGSRRLFGSAPGTSAIDGVPIGDADEESVVFLAEIGSEGFTGVQRIAAGEIFDAQATSLPDGDLLMLLQWTGPSSLAGEALPETGRELVRFDPATEAVESRWSVTPELRVSVAPAAGGVEVRGSLGPSDPPLTIGETSYENLEPPEPFTDPVETFVQILWDGTGELPVGTRWPVDARYTEGGIATGQRNHIAFVRRDDTGGIARWFGGTRESLDFPPEVFRLDDRIYVTVGSRSGRTQLLYNATPEGFTTITLEAPAVGSGALWFLEVSADTGEVLRQRTIDLGPNDGPEYVGGYAHPLDGEHFLVSVSRGGSGIEEVWVEGWDGARTPLPVTADCPARTLASVTGLNEIFPGLPFAPDPSLVSFRVFCEEGAHTARLDGQGYEYEESSSSALFRITVD